LFHEGNGQDFQIYSLTQNFNISIVDGRTGKIVEINVSGQKKKLEDVDVLINALIMAKQWLVDNKL